MSTGKDTRERSGRQGKTRLTTVSAANPCPVCDGDHKCSVGDDALIVCGRRRGKVKGFVHLGEADGDPQFVLYRRRDGDPAVQKASSPGTIVERPVINWTGRA